VDLSASERACRLHVPRARTFSQFLSATIGPSVARVSAPRTMPSLKRQPTIVVPVLVARGTGMPFSCKNVFLPHSQVRGPGGGGRAGSDLTWFEKSKPDEEAPSMAADVIEVETRTR
jgi:hypothetical protein